jgi:hypothetical protein
MRACSCSSVVVALALRMLTNLHALRRSARLIPPPRLPALNGDAPYEPANS